MKDLEKSTKLTAAIIAALLSLLAGRLCLDVLAAQSGQGIESLTIYNAQEQTILVDDYEGQLPQGLSFWPHNRLGGDGGPIGGTGSGTVIRDSGVVTATITGGMNVSRGVWTSLNHPILDCEPLDFSAIFPVQIAFQYQSRLTKLQLHLLDGQGTFRVQLQIGEPTACPPQISRWTSQNISLTGGPQILQFSLPTPLREVQNLNWFVIGNSGDFVIVDRVELIAEAPQLDTPERAFLLSYTSLLANWDSNSGLTRDTARFAAGEFDNISASGMQAAAAVTAWHLGFISRAAATGIVTKTTQALHALPRCHGLWPHFVNNGQIISGTEWSTIDTLIALIALIEARQALGLDPTQIETMLKDIDWNALILANGSLSHGYITDCSQRIEDNDGGLEGGWRDFGTESWLVNWAYASATGNVAEFDHTPPTYNGSGFIDELSWLLAPSPCDRWGTDWHTYRQEAANRQLEYYQTHPDYGGPPRLFGLSAAEVPDLSAVSSTQIYQAFGVGGETSSNDGSSLLGHAVIVPHYAALAASLRPGKAIALWEWLEMNGLFTPLNNVESLMITTDEQIVWNALRGSWNLSLQTLGWGRLLAGSDNPLYESMWDNNVLREGFTTMSGSTCRTYLPILQKSDNLQK